MQVKKAEENSTLPHTLASIIGEVADSVALQQAHENLARDGKLSIEGVWLGALPPLVAAWSKYAPTPLLVIVSHLAEAESVVGELSDLTELPIDLFPPGSEDQELESLTQQETAQRLHVLSRLFQYAQDSGSS